MRIFLGVLGVIATIAFFQVYRANSELLEAQNLPVRTENPKDGEIPDIEAESRPAVDFCGLDSVQCESELPESTEKRVRHYSDKFGFNDPDLLITLSKGESGLVEDKVSKPNSNGTYDVGAFQINDVHVCELQIKKFGKEKGGCIKSEDRKNLEIATKWTIEKIEAGALYIWVFARKAGLKYNT